VQQVNIQQLRAAVAASDDPKMLSLVEHLLTCNGAKKIAAPVDAPNPKGSPALHAALSVGHNKMVHLLLRYGTSVNALRPGSLSPLHAAISCVNASQRVPLVQLLLQRGTNVNAAAAIGTPLIMAA
jgi:ankyrin repeat protein